MVTATKIKPMTQIQKKYLKERVDDIKQYARTKMQRIETANSREINRRQLKKEFLKRGYDTTSLLNLVDKILSRDLDPSMFGYSIDGIKNCTIDIKLKDIVLEWESLVNQVWNRSDNIDNTKDAIINNINHKGNFLQDDIILSFHNSYDKVCDKVKVFQEWTEEQVKSYEEQVNEFNNQHKDI